MEIDELGLDGVDRRMLESIIYNFNGGPVGLDTLAATIGEESVTLEDVYEPYLMQIGFLQRTNRCRWHTKKKYFLLQHLNAKPSLRSEHNPLSANIMLMPEISSKIGRAHV